MKHNPHPNGSMNYCEICEEEKSKSLMKDMVLGYLLIASFVGLIIVCYFIMFLGAGGAVTK